MTIKAVKFDNIVQNGCLLSQINLIAKKQNENNKLINLTID